ncbi:tetratricopeptide repeat protein [Candidatus Woesearchaeota archaeon]|nr:tetratricopeptide repeat protein [Candidatus Woesearchaeota archaeon]
MADKTISLEPKGFWERKQANKSYPKRLRKIAEKYQNCFEVQDTLFGDNAAVQYLTSLAEDTLNRNHHASKEDKIFDNLEEKFSNLADQVLVGNPHYQQPVFNLAKTLHHKGFNNFASITYHALSETELEPHLCQQVRLGLIGTRGENLGLKKDEKIPNRKFVEEKIAEFINEDPAISGDYDPELLDKAMTNYGIDYGRTPSPEGSLFSGSHFLWMEQNKEEPNEENLKLAKEDLELALKGNPELFVPIYLIETHYSINGKNKIADVATEVLAPHNIKTLRLDFTDKLIAKAREYRDLGRYDDCIDVCNRVIINNPDNYHASYYKGTANMMARNLDEAEINLSEALKLKPKHEYANKFLNQVRKELDFKKED